jgi:hypothetical protein
MADLIQYYFLFPQEQIKDTIITSASFIHSIKDIVIVKRRHQRRARGGCQWFSSLGTAVDAPAGAA